MIRHITPCRLVDIRRASLDRAASGWSFSTVYIYKVTGRRNADVFNPEQLRCQNPKSLVIEITIATKCTGK